MVLNLFIKIDCQSYVSTRHIDGARFNFARPGHLKAENGSVWVTPPFHSPVRPISALLPIVAASCYGCDKIRQSDGAKAIISRQQCEGNYISISAH